MRLWQVSKLWPDSTAFIIGGGPSLEDLNLSLVHSKNVIGVNDAFKLGDWVDICWWGDCRWGVWNHDALQEFGGLSVSCTRCNCQHPDTLQVRRREGFGISTCSSEVFWNRSSGASAINLAYHLGAARIVLLGFDMTMRDGNHNWHSNHRSHPRPSIYQERFLPPFEKIAEDAKRLKLEILNASPGSELKVFPMVKLEEVVNG
jgi:hypothetical protein